MMICCIAMPTMLRLPRQAIRRYTAAPYSAILKKKTKRGTTDKTSRDHVLHHDISAVLATKQMLLDTVRVPERLIHQFLFPSKSVPCEVDNVHIVAVSSEGDGLGFVHRNQYDPDADAAAVTVVKVPKTTVGDIVRVLLRRHHVFYAEADLLAVSRKSRKLSRRNDRLIACSHFDDCSGCQLQMVLYDDQLAFKHDVIARAYRYFYPGLNTAIIPDFGFVVGSPMQLAYRTKLTPHAKLPRKLADKDVVTNVGFDNVRAAQPVVDVKACPIAVSTINRMLPVMKESFRKRLQAAAGGASPKVDSTFVLRDSIRIDHATGEYTNVCLTNRQQVVTEKVDDYVFQFPANEFFQNNRSILPTFLDFIKHHLAEIRGGYKYLVDAYCGSGFLGISLSRTLPDDGKVFGIEIAKTSIRYAEHNAGINGIRIPDRIEFVHGNSDAIFTNGNFLASGVSGADSVVLMNPSRKGSTKTFMRQLLEYRPKAIVYVSCNVFSQARDLEDFQSFQNDTTAKYRVKTVTGFDFYPQTKHVESVAILELVE